MVYFGLAGSVVWPAWWWNTLYIVVLIEILTKTLIKRYVYNILMFQYFKVRHVNSATTYRPQVFFKLIRSRLSKVWNLGSVSIDLVNSVNKTSVCVQEARLILIFAAPLSRVVKTGFISQRCCKIYSIYSLAEIEIYSE